MIKKDLLNNYFYNTEIVKILFVLRLIYNCVRYDFNLFNGMGPQPERKINIAIGLINLLASNNYNDEHEGKEIANKANIEAWKAYKSSNDIDSVTVYAITEAVTGKFNKSIKLF
jgi:hypothetical protein